MILEHTASHSFLRRGYNAMQSHDVFNYITCLLNLFLKCQFKQLIEIVINNNYNYNIPVLNVHNTSTCKETNDIIETHKRHCIIHSTSYT